MGLRTPGIIGEDGQVSERHIRPYRPADRDAIAAICLDTGDSGAGARGLFRHDGLLGDVYAVPYVVHDPGLAFVVDRDGEAIGYVLATADTAAFNAWFRKEWWPSVRAGYNDVADGSRDARIVAVAETIGAGDDAYAADYPAHLHIDLLPATQGGGFGRALIDTVLAALRERGVVGVHLVASAENHNAVAFYEHLGFTRLPSSPDTAAFGMRL